MVRQIKRRSRRSSVVNGWKCCNAAMLRVQVRVAALVFDAHRLLLVFGHDRLKFSSWDIFARGVVIEGFDD